MNDRRMHMPGIKFAKNGSRTPLSTRCRPACPERVSRREPPCGAPCASRRSMSGRGIYFSFRWLPLGMPTRPGHLISGLRQGTASAPGAFAFVGAGLTPPVGATRRAFVFWSAAARRHFVFAVRAKLEPRALWHGLQSPKVCRVYHQQFMRRTPRMLSTSYDD